MVTTMTATGRTEEEVVVTYSRRHEDVRREEGGAGAGELASSKKEHIQGECGRNLEYFLSSLFRFSFFLHFFLFIFVLSLRCFAVFIVNIYICVAVMVVTNGRMGMMQSPLLRKKEGCGMWMDGWN